VNAEIGFEAFCCRHINFKTLLKSTSKHAILFRKLRRLEPRGFGNCPLPKSYVYCVKPSRQAPLSVCEKYIFAPNNSQTVRLYTGFLPQRPSADLQIAADLRSQADHTALHTPLQSKLPRRRAIRDTWLAPVSGHVVNKDNESDHKGMNDSTLTSWTDSIVTPLATHKTCPNVITTTVHPADVPPLEMG